MTQFSIPAEVLKDALAPVTAIVDEAKVSFTEGGINISAIDAANVAMVDMSITESGFERIEGSGIIGLNLDRFSEVLTMADDGDIVRCQLDESSSVLQIQIDVLSFSIGLLDPETIRQEPDIPEPEHEAEVTFEAAEMRRGLTAAGFCSDNVRLRADVDERTFHIFAEGDTDSSDLTLSDDDLETAEVEADCTATYTLDYLESMERPIPTRSELSVQFSTDSRLQLDYELHEGDVVVENVLAPRRDAEGSG